MKNKIDASTWLHHTPENKDGEEKRSCQVYFFDSKHDRNKLKAFVTLDVRCPEPVTVSLIDADGQTLVVGQGPIVTFKRHLVGYVGVEIIGNVTFAYQCNFTKNWFEKNDGVPFAVTVDESTKKPLADLIRAELQKYVARQNLQEEVESVTVDELLDDITNGDSEFEEEPDMFGLGYEERHKAWQEAQEAEEAPTISDEPNTAEAPPGASTVPSEATKTTPA